MKNYKGRNIFWAGNLGDEVSKIRDIEVAGYEKRVYGLEANVIGIDKVKLCPAQISYCGIGRGKVDTVVVYKVDRLTRSLSEFAKIVDAVRCFYG
jgi:hypothetical protein